MPDFGKRLDASKVRREQANLEALRTSEAQRQAAYEASWRRAEEARRAAEAQQRARRAALVQSRDTQELPPLEPADPSMLNLWLRDPQSPNVDLSPTPEALQQWVNTTPQPQVRVPGQALPPADPRMAALAQSDPTNPNLDLSPSPEALQRWIASTPQAQRPRAPQQGLSSGALAQLLQLAGTR